MEWHSLRLCFVGHLVHPIKHYVGSLAHFVHIAQFSCKLQLWKFLVNSKEIAPRKLTRSKELEWNCCFKKFDCFNPWLGQTQPSGEISFSESCKSAFLCEKRKVRHSTVRLSTALVVSPHRLASNRLPQGWTSSKEIFTPCPTPLAPLATKIGWGCWNDAAAPSWSSGLDLLVGLKANCPGCLSSKTPPYSALPPPHKRGVMQYRPG